jgi:hypothetical protein
MKSVTIGELRTIIQELETKLADPVDCDDKKWTERWLKRYQAELAKKLDGKALKIEEMSKPKSRRRTRS